MTLALLGWIKQYPLAKIRIDPEKFYSVCKVPVKFFYTIGEIRAFDYKLKFPQPSKKGWGRGTGVEECLICHIL